MSVRSNADFLHMPINIRPLVTRPDGTVCSEEETREFWQKVEDFARQWERTGYITDCPRSG